MPQLILTFEQQVMLLLNADRIHALRTIRQVDAIEIALGKRSIPEEWFLWTTPSPYEAAKLQAEQNRSHLAES